jgi:uncharacterized protein
VSGRGGAFPVFFCVGPIYYKGVKPMKREMVWKIAALIEVIIASVVIILDLFIPTIVVLGLIIISLLVRKENISILGFKRSDNPLRMFLFILFTVIIWSLLQLSLFMPVTNHLSGTVQDVSAFAGLKGNLGELITFLILTWSLAAFGEEIVYRGYIQRRITDVFGENNLGAIMAIGISSILFGIAHTEQGIVGVIIVSLDAVLFSLLKRKFNNNLWASILAHGLINTIGLVTYYFTGPISGFW